MPRPSLIATIFALALLSVGEAAAWPSACAWRGGWTACGPGVGCWSSPLVARPCNVAWFCPPRCGPAWGWCGSPAFYSASSWSFGGLNFTSWGFSRSPLGPGWGWAAGPRPVPFRAGTSKVDRFLATRQAGSLSALAAAPPAAAPARPRDPSSAARPAPSIAALRGMAHGGENAAQLAAAEPLDRELELRAERAVASGKVGMARLYLQMALEEAAGARREALRARLAALAEPAATAQVAGAPAAAAR